MGLFGCGHPGSPAAELLSPKSQSLWEQLRQKTDAWLKKPWGRRGDGFTYTVDVGHLMVYAALIKDKPLYQLMRDFAVKNLLQNSKDDPYTKGFILWRYKKGEAPDASGTTEALRVAEGLWLGHKVWKSVEDKEFALLILKGYIRHEYVDQGVWFIRNYFNIATRSFSINTYLVDYDPDFLLEVGKETKDVTIQQAAKKSLALVKKAVAPSGLIYPLLQPEVLTLLPKSIVFFAPNDIVKILNSASVAERVAMYAPEIGQKIVDIGLKHIDDLNKFFYASSGELAMRDSAGAVTYAVLLRLACRLGEKKKAQIIEGKLAPHVEFFLKNSYDPRLYVTGEVMLAYQYLKMLKEGIFP